jgi:hypothetical protein
MKVTDKRMFTPEGELREEYRFLEDQAKRPEPEGRPAKDAGAPASAAPSPEPEQPAAATVEPSAQRPPLDAPGAGPGGPAFFDLLGVLAEPIAFYLGDARLPTGETEENLDAARFHIDLLDVLRQKTSGNLTAQEADALEDLLYRLRVRYVQKRG